MILQPAYSVGEWHYGIGVATISVHTAMHCRSFRDDDILNVLNSSAVCKLFTNLHQRELRCLRQHLHGETCEFKFADTMVLFCMPLSFASIA